MELLRTLPIVALTTNTRAKGQSAAMRRPEPDSSSILPTGYAPGFVENVNGLRVHVLEAGRGTRPCVLLLDGFPNSR
jgi:hypothetical protein